ncbi:ABC transporter substrate-binding protein [Asaia astilbis]|uniref:ABC transporter substrate-binding protein n=1 Tax=Asaia astilbis TaxID=610244 RepID=UPI000AF6AB4C|nr:ABC transporter substrate-binding protein [Asaia astilbis]
MTLNAEAVLALHPDLVFVTKQSNSAEMLGRLGLNVETVEFSDFKGLIGTIDQTAALLGTDLAKTQAEHYGKAFSALDERQPVAAHPPRILHIASFAPLTVDGEGTIIDEWIRDAGGLNAATGLHGNKRPVSLEQILSWAPDLIILGADAGEPDPAQGSGLWSRLAAVQHGRVFRNPAGVFNWDRYSPELLLQRIWARDLVRTGSVDRPQMIKKIRDFYRDFYRHPIDQDDAVRILNAKPPLPEKCSGVTDEVGK